MLSGYYYNIFTVRYQLKRGVENIQRKQKNEIHQDLFVYQNLVPKIAFKQATGQILL